MRSMNCYGRMTALASKARRPKRGEREGHPFPCERVRSTGRGPDDKKYGSKQTSRGSPAGRFPQSVFCGTRRVDAHPAPILSLGCRLGGTATSAARASSALCCKGEAAADRSQHQHVGRFLFGEIDEVLAAAMHWEDVLKIEFLQLGHHLAQVVVGRGSRVETADPSTE